MINTNRTQRGGWNLNNSYAQLPGVFFQKLDLKPVDSPGLVIFNSSLAKSLGLDPEVLQKEEGVNIFAGNQMPEGAFPLAQAYSGHQFGTYRMLGDGRGLLIGEQMTPEDKRFDLQLKGSGNTMYSRGLDGRAALGPMLREYIISEAMYSLGIPTTRTLAVVKTGESIIRETPLTGAVMTRVAKSHLRVGTFQYAADTRDLDHLQTLADYTIQRHYPEISDGKDRHLQLFKKIMYHQADLIARWQLIGFVHGVMNTDNMAISGETIDYGPCAFLDTYNLTTVFSSKDVHGRYAYGSQPHMAEWNLTKLAEALTPLFHDNLEKAKQLAEEVIAQFMPLYEEKWFEGMAKKLGIFNKEIQDDTLIEDLLSLMQKHEADYTNTFRALTLKHPEDIPMSKSKDFDKWYKRWQERLERQIETDEAIQLLMKHHNPSVIPRNHRVEEALKKAVENNDYSILKQLVRILSTPYAYTAEQEEYTKLPEISSKPYVTYCGT